MKTVTLSVRGMHCDGCASRVESALSELDGVRRVVVSLDEEEARVDVEGGAGEGSLIEAVENAGYEASLLG